MRRGIEPYWWPDRALLLVLLPALALAGGRREPILDLDSGAEHELAERINHSREEQGLPKLEWSRQLAEAARTHSLEMANRRQLTHRFPEEPELRQRVSSTGLRFDLVGENVGRSGDVDSMHEGFLRSPGHRANILEPRANAVGVGAVRLGDELFVTEDFAHTVPDYEPEEVEKLVAQGIEELRKQARLPRLSHAASQPLREQACDMARRDSVRFDRGAYPRTRGALQNIAYATGDPASLPEPLRKLAASQQPESFSVGACSARTASFPSGGYWVVVVFYSSR
jgi:hypothetical protein